MALGSVDQFKARLTGGGARSNLFQVTMNNPRGGLGVDVDADLSSFLCEAAQLPASTVGTIIVPFRGRQLKIAGDRSFAEWTVTIINDVNFKLRNAFETWMNAIANHADIGGTQNPELYFADLQVSQFDRNETVKKTYTFKDCWPADVSAIDLSYAAEDIERFTVTWNYQYWTSNTTDGVNAA
jgi:hypothetical protein|tara:strand:- start:3859 stop:4407 length:549 start_codon:yes stop_codon:yes gene_type:complete